MCLRLITLSFKWLKKVYNYSRDIINRNKLTTVKQYLIAKCQSRHMLCAYVCIIQYIFTRVNFSSKRKRLSQLVLCSNAFTDSPIHIIYVDISVCLSANQIKYFNRPSVCVSYTQLPLKSIASKIFAMKSIRLLL